MLANYKKYNLFFIYLLGFLFAFGVALMAYKDSSFLNTFLQQKFVGNVYTIAYIFVIICFLIIPFILKLFGNFKTALFLIIIELLALLGVSFLEDPIWLIICLLINFIIIPLVYFLTDIFLEGFSNNKITGTIRGIYLTVINLAWVLAQIISGSILINGNYQRVYFASFLIIVPIVLILVFGLRDFKDSEYQSVNIWETLKLVWKNKNIFNIVAVNFLLSFFYSWMVIYIPMYLNETIGFSWVEIGIIFSIMLLPFVFVQFPLGYLADKKWGEKEILCFGFIILAMSTGVISFISGSSLIVWSTVLFFTRIGAATVEVMSNAYFFKKVDGLNANIISFFRMSGTLAYLFGALFATLILSFSPYGIKSLFILLGIIMITGLGFSLSLKDTK